MTKWRHHIIIYIGILSVIAGFALKAFYFGWLFLDHGQAGEYSVKSYKTVYDLRVIPVWKDNDAAGGYYRIFNSKGRKVFEKFSSQLNFDLVLMGDDRVEFQLDGMERKLIWTPGSVTAVEY